MTEGSYGRRTDAGRRVSAGRDLPCDRHRAELSLEKLSAYECGFNAFDDARMKFDVRFYLVSILFIIFDLEVAFLFPWAITLQDMAQAPGAVRVLVDDGVPRRADGRLCL
jgi:hypothetical protein